MSELEAGTVVTLYDAREVPFGYFLTDGTEDVLLHHTEVPENFNPEDDHTVFLYQDHDGRLSATFTIPDVRQGRYGWTEVVDVKESLGVFINIGLQKDVLVSKDDLPELRKLWPVAGDRLLCSLKTDRKGRLFGKLATEEIFTSIGLKADQRLSNKQVQGNVYRLLLAGTNFITDDGYLCFIHQSERGEEPRLGQKVEGRVIEVKKDGTLNVSLLPRGHEAMDEDADTIFAYLVNRGGAMPYGDKSHPEDIKKRFSMSKASFKRALGKLMKQGKVRQEDGWTRLSDKES